MPNDKALVVTPFYKPAFVYGGPTRSIPSLCEGLVSHDVDVEVYTTNANGSSHLNVELGKAKNVDGVSVTHFQSHTLLGRFFYSPNLREHVGETCTNFDYVYTYGIWNYPAIAAAIECRRQNVPYIVSPRSGLMEWPLSQGWLRKRVFLRLLGYKYLSNAWTIHYTTVTERRESSKLPFKNDSIVVPNPLDFEEFAELPDPGRFRRRYNIDQEQSLVLFLGRIEPRKGLDIALRSFANIKEDVDAAFAIAGDGESGYLDRMKSLTSSLNLRDSAIFTGYLDACERLEALVDADVFILTSHTENFAMAAVEAMAAGTPVLLSNEVGVAEPADKSGAGVSVPLQLPDISHALRDMLLSETVLKEMGKKAWHHARNNYNKKMVAKRFIRKIESRGQ